jgi:hypothetical protein
MINVNIKNLFANRRQIGAQTYLITVISSRDISHNMISVIGRKTLRGITAIKNL